MLRHIFAFSTVALTLAASAGQPIKVVLLGESTANDEGGPRIPRFVRGGAYRWSTWRATDADGRASATKARGPKCCRRKRTSCRSSSGDRKSTRLNSSHLVIS